MGEVYRATDTKLNRDVALKVLPEAFASDPERLARFQREAEVLASLNHPNIAAIHGLEEADGVRALVLELVEGPTLADRIAQGPIPLAEAIAIAKQIAEALEAAHEAGVIHRDLKPANVKVKSDDTVKVLDFGLAKALEGDTGSDPSESPTLTAAATQMGVIMGTAAYMSPEQAAGRTADKRSDIWSFGVVLFEMLTGQRLFTGETVSHVLGGVLRIDPDWNTLPTVTPEPLRRLLRHCLHKDRKRRLRDIGDGLTELDDALTAQPTETTATPVAQPAGWRQALPLALGTLIVGSLITGLAVWTLKPSPPQPVARFPISVPPSVPVSPIGPSDDVAISADGTRVVYQAADRQLYVRQINQIEAAPLRGALPAVSPFLQPDGAWVGFMAGPGGPLQKVSVFGGPPVTICELPANLRGASWGEDDMIIFGTASSDGLMRVSGAGGEPEAITTPEQSRHKWPDILPGGVGVLFTVDRAPGLGTEDIALLNMETREHHVIIPGGTHPQYSPTGHIVYGVEGTLRAVAFDLDTREVTSDPVPVVEGVLMKRDGAASFDLSETGALVYVSGATGTPGGTRTFVWVDRQGREEVLPLPPRSYQSPRVSPDGRRVAVAVEEEEGFALWAYDVISAGGLRLTHEAQVSNPLWTPDGGRLVFRWDREGSPDIYWVPADGSGEPERLTTSETRDFPTSLTPDGRTVVFIKIDDQRREIWHVPIEGERTPTPVVQGEFARGNAEVSPNGNWLAYRSDQSGQIEVYLQPYPGPGPTVPVSIGGGNHVTWSRDGSELFYRQGTSMMAVEVNADGTVGTPTELFDGNYVMSGGRGVRQYHVAPDGRFLMLRSGDTPTTDTEVLTQVVLVQNFAEELTRLFPDPTCPP